MWQCTCVPHGNASGEVAFIGYGTMSFVASGAQAFVVLHMFA
jgi:hypothetical protein